MSQQLTVGMLWYMGPANTRPGIEESIIQAAEFYAAKHGRAPTIVHVNPRDSEHVPLAVGRIAVNTDRTIQRGHLWLGEGSAA